MAGEPWWSSWPPTLVPYAILLRRLVGEHIPADEFEAVYLPLYRNDPTIWSSDLFAVLDGFFADLDDYCADPQLRGVTGGLSADQLRDRAAAAYERLEALVRQDQVPGDTSTTGD